MNGSPTLVEKMNIKSNLLMYHDEYERRYKLNSIIPKDLGHWLSSVQDFWRRIDRDIMDISNKKELVPYMSYLDDVKFLVKHSSDNFRLNLNNTELDKKYLLLSNSFIQLYPWSTLKEDPMWDFLKEWSSTGTALTSVGMFSNWVVSLCNLIYAAKYQSEYFEGDANSWLSSTFKHSLECMVRLPDEHPLQMSFSFIASQAVSENNIKQYLNAVFNCSQPWAHLLCAHSHSSKINSSCSWIAQGLQHVGLDAKLEHMLVIPDIYDVQRKERAAEQAWWRYTNEMYSRPSYKEFLNTIAHMLNATPRSCEKWNCSP